MWIDEMSPQDFKNVPRFNPRGDSPTEFDSVVIIPQATLHNGRSRYMDFVACKNGEPLYRMSGISDVLHIDGIGGKGNVESEINAVVPKGWKINCLPCGYLQLRCNRKLTSGKTKTDFVLYGVKA